MSVTVAEEGNRRVGEMTDDEVRQCVGDIKCWFERHGCDISGISRSESQQLQKALECSMPESFQMFLSQINGTIYFMDKKALDAETIIDVSNHNINSRKWKAAYIPFCGEDDSFLVIDSDNGKVYEWDSEDGIGDLLSRSFSQYLEDYRNSLLEGHMEYLSDVGVIENMTTAKSKK